MKERITTQISFPLDEKGYLGRACPTCNQYFKVKPKDKLPTHSSCPYCGYSGYSKEFFTEEQLRYLKDVVVNKTIGPLLQNTFDKINRNSKNSLIRFELKGVSQYPIEKYQERILETEIPCANCGLEFSIYGVFSNCPNCGQLNAKTIFEKSLVSSKKLIILGKNGNADEEMGQEHLKNALIGAISAFDALGKALRRKHPKKIASNTKNLFQNFRELDRSLKIAFGKNVSDYLTNLDSAFLLKMFQVRHLYEHNAGVIDDDFVRILPAFLDQKGRKYQLNENEIESFLDKIGALGVKIFYEFEGK